MEENMGTSWDTMGKHGTIIGKDGTIMGKDGKRWENRGIEMGNVWKHGGHGKT